MTILTGLFCTKCAIGRLVEEAQARSIPRRLVDDPGALGWRAQAKFLEELQRVVRQVMLVELVVPHALEGRLGRLLFPVKTMLRIYFVLQWFTLSDPRRRDWRPAVAGLGALKTRSTRRCRS